MELRVLIASIKNLPELPDAEKQKWIERIEKEGVTTDLLWDFELALSDNIEKGFSKINLPKSVYPEELANFYESQKKALHDLESLKKEVPTIVKDTLKKCDAVAVDDIRKGIKKEF